MPALPPIDTLYITKKISNRPAVTRANLTSDELANLKVYDLSCVTINGNAPGTGGVTWASLSGNNVNPTNINYALGYTGHYWAALYATDIYGYLHGNITGSSSSCTGNSATATNATYASYLNGQPGSFYQNANNINAGTLNENQVPHQFNYATTFASTMSISAAVNINLERADTQLHEAAQEYSRS